MIFSEAALSQSSDDTTAFVGMFGISMLKVEYVKALTTIWLTIIISVAALCASQKNNDEPSEFRQDLFQSNIIAG